MRTAAIRLASVALVAASACSPREVQAAEPTADAEQQVASSPAPAPSQRAAVPPTPELEPGAPPPPVDELEDLAALVARLEDPDAPAPVLAPADLARLFQHPERATAAGLQASRFELDVVGDGSADLVAVVSQGWFGEWFWVLLLEPLPGCWRVAAQTRIDGVCRGLPRLEAIALGERRWIRAQWVDALSERARTQALALIEPLERRLEPVLRVAHDGYLSGGRRSLSASFSLEGLELGAADDGVDLRLAYSVSASADETGLGSLLWAADEVAVRLRQPAPGQPFVPIEPLAMGAVDPDYLSARALETWLAEHAELTGRLALEGNADQKLVLLELAERMLARGGSPQARALIAVLPPRGELEAAAAIR